MNQVKIHTKKELLNALSKNREMIKLFGVTSLGIFGSFSKGKIKESSDVDLLVDFDPQGSLSIGLGVITDELESSIYNLLMDRNASVDEVLLKTTVPGMDLIPSDIMLSGAEIGLVN